MPFSKSVAAIKPSLISVNINNPVIRGLNRTSITEIKKTLSVIANTETTQGSLENTVRYMVRDGKLGKRK